MSAGHQTTERDRDAGQHGAYRAVESRALDLRYEPVVVRDDRLHLYVWACLEVRQAGDAAAPRPSTGPVVRSRGVAAVVASILKRRLAHLEQADVVEAAACPRVEIRLTHAEVAQKVGVAALRARGDAAKT